MSTFITILVAYAIIGGLTAVVMGGYVFFIYVILARKHGFTWLDWFAGLGLSSCIGLAGGVTWPWVWYKQIRSRLQ